jgi:galactokinase
LTTDAASNADARHTGFDDLFGRPPAVRASAPGRVNLIGEHTDYNGGFVLPAAIPQRTVVELAPRDDRLARVWSANTSGGAAPEEYTIGSETRGRGWLDYLQGVTSAMSLAGYAIGGFDARIGSAVPVGSGLSSSAALEVAFARALRELFSLPVPDIELALIARRAENEFVGAPVGIMDQMAASFADENTAIFLDTRTMEFERVALPDSVELVVINSGVVHGHAGGEYRVRRSECEEACRQLGVAELRDVGLDDLGRVAALPDPLSRRARHVVTENARVLAAVRALREGDIERLGELFDQSHASMRDDYEISIVEIDLIVSLARTCEGVAGARLTGGGFGGSVVVLAATGAGRRIADNVSRAYARTAGRTATVLLPQ